MGRNRSHRRRFRGARDADARRTTALRSLITAAAVARCLAAPRRVLAICIKGTEYAEIGGGFVVVDRWSDAPFPSTNPNRAEFLGVVRPACRAVPPAELRAWQMFLLQLYGEYAGIYLTTIGRDDCTHSLAFDGDRPVAAAGLCVTGTTSTVRHLDNARGGVHGGCLVRWRLEEIHRDTSGVSRRLVGPISVCGGGGNDNE